MLTRTALASALHSLGFSTFTDKSCYPKSDAKRNLEGRTHFADDDTLRFFGSRILSATDHCDGLLYSLIESSYQDWNKTRRTVRFAVFDVFGTCIYRPDIEAGYRTSKQANKARYAWLNAFDVDAWYAEQIKSRSLRLQRDAQALNDILCATVPA
jgi:hypothetical protein